jgi:hypothetical protein
VRKSETLIARFRNVELNAVPLSRGVRGVLITEYIDNQIDNNIRPLPKVKLLRGSGALPAGIK